MKPTIYAFGGERLERVTVALEDRYDVVYQQEVMGEGWWIWVPFLNSLVAFLLTYDFLRRRKPIVLADEFGFTRLIVLFLCHHHGCCYLSRVRGSMWNEFRDYSSNVEKLSQKVENFKDEVIRNAILRRSDRIQAVSYFNRMQITYELHIDPDRIDVVYESCDFEAFDDAPEGAFKPDAGIPADEKLLLTVTNFDYREKVRGIEYFFPEIRRVLEANPEWHYVVAGEGTFFDEFRSEILDACDDALAERVHFVGYYSPVERLFADADIVLHPSFRDALPNTVIEAQVARVPVVVNSDGGMQESLPDEFREYQVVHEREAFLDSTETLVDDPELRRTIGRRNRGVAEERFSRNAVERMFERSIRRTRSPNQGLS